MRGSIPLSSAKLNKMRDIKKEMTMIKGGDFLEWYDSLDAVEKAQYKVEFNKLQEEYQVPLNVILNNSKSTFEEDLIQSRIEQAIKDASEWIEESSFECIQEAMSKHDVIPIDEYKELDYDELDKRFDKNVKATSERKVIKIRM